MVDKIAVLFGGPSSEADVSKSSSEAMSSALSELNMNHELVELVGNWQQRLIDGAFTSVLLGLHGCPGEDGSVQGVLDLMGFSYQGSGVLASAVAMDKPLSKKLFALAGLNVAKEQVFEASALPKTIDGLEIPLPVVVKPASGGSSVGVTIVENESDWHMAAVNAKVCGGQVMVEEFIPGRELTVAVMGDKSLEVTEIKPLSGHDFYNYASKYEEGGSGHVLPAPISPELYGKCKKQALLAHQTLGCKGVTRTDFRYDEKDDRLVVLEVNTLPGMTATSLVPEQAAYQGVSFVELVKWMVEDAEKCQEKIA